jgi:hypothetical protein
LDIAKSIGQDNIGEVTIEQLFLSLQKTFLADQPDLDIEGTLNYLNQMIDTYLIRRKNIFAILGKNDADQD